MTTFLTKSRKDRLLHERIHDPCKPSRKPPEPSVCPVCQAVFKRGRWQWLEFWPADAPREICQACKRIRDNYPAGYVTMSGELIKTHRGEVVNLARHQERNERALHPLHRIMRIEETPGRVVIATTDIHLPKRIGQALRRAYKGRLALNYDRESCFVRVNWTSRETKNQRNQEIAKKASQL